MSIYQKSLIKIKNDCNKYPAKNSERVFRYLVKKYWLDYVPAPSEQLLEKLKLEELSELSNGMTDQDPVEILDGLCDSIFVMAQHKDEKLSLTGIDFYLKELSRILGTKIDYSKLLEAFCIVVASNYTKLNIIDGKPNIIFNNYGKIMKPSSFVDAKLELIGFIDKHRGKPL